MPIQAHMWDAVSMLAGAKESRAAIALSPLLPLLVHRALGRGVPQPVRVAAMHALAACAGAEETSSDADMLRALLSPEVRWPAVLRAAMHAVHDRGLVFCSLYWSAFTSTAAIICAQLCSGTGCDRTDEGDLHN